MRIIKKAPTEYQKFCTYCGCTFGYTLEDIVTTYTTAQVVHCPNCRVEHLHFLKEQADVQQTPIGWIRIPEEGLGQLSDGYHTFNELYHHRAVLFSVICNLMPEMAWKSRQHSTGDMYEGMFIVGIETPEGQATYHYDLDPYWDMFQVREIERAPEWDGHDAQEAARRISLLSKTKEN